MYDIIIIGAGPAGLTAGIYAKRASKKVLILEALSYGGQIINTPLIENYPGESNISGFDFATNLYNQARNLGVEVKFEKVEEINDNKDLKEVITNKERYESKAVIIATGCTNRKIGLTNENELIGKGVSYCATCDGNFYRGKIVAVVGGGNTALEDAIFLSSIASKVYLIHRRDEFRAEQKIIDLLKEKDNVEFILNSNISKLNANEILESIDIKTNDETRNIKVDGLFIAVGRVPQNEIFSNLINTDQSGYIIADEKCHTNVAGIFVAGDNRTKELRQLVTATSDGAISATEAVKYINNK